VPALAVGGALLGEAWFVSEPLVGGAIAEAAPRVVRPTIALRPGDPLPALGPEARVDRGLQAAAEELAASATTIDARLTPSATRLALGRAGYPGDARFALARTPDEALPAALLDGIPRGEPVDVGWAVRDVPGARLWILGWAPRRLQLDPIARDLTVGQGISVRIDGAEAPRLLVAHPEGKVDELRITNGVGRWVDRFTVPGEHRLEIVDGDRVELLFSVFVGGGPPAPAPLAGRATPPDPAGDLPHLYAALDAVRAAAGLRPLTRFAAFEDHARAHAACLAQAGVVAHATASCPGVPELAKRTHFPRAKHTENVAAGDSAEEAWERVLASPGHRQNLLCETCTHASVGATLESGPSPRIFVVWELLTFPEGPPEPVPTRR